MRLAGVSTLLTFVILCGFAVVVGDLTVRRIRSDFNRQVDGAATALVDQIKPTFNQSSGAVELQPHYLDYLAASTHAAIRLTTPDGTLLCRYCQTTGAPDLGPPRPQDNTVNGYRVDNLPGSLTVRGLPFGQLVIQYGRRLSDVEATVARVRLLLVLGVLGGTGVALLAGLMIARRAMVPIARLTSTAREIARTRDPSRSVPQPESEDEVAELARTFDEMLRALDSARGETEAMLTQQRQFVADASHELRTPLTSVLANLELLAESLDGDQGDAARSALRSSRRMRRLVADLLLLARSDVGRVVQHEPTDLAQIAVEAAAELGPISADHEIELDIQAAVADGVRDELLRLAINLVENAVRHTPPGTHVRLHTRPAGTGSVELVVEDEGPGVPPELAPHLFERFVRGTGDRGGSFGLGLAIVRAVAESHGGRVVLDRTAPRGARFVVTLPAALPAARREPAAELTR